MLLVAAAGGAGLLYIAAYTAWQRGRAPHLPEATPRAPSTVALVPARNEANNLPACLDALGAQTAPLTVVVIDDVSSDGTAAVAARHPARVLAAAAMPPGWRGKVNALAAGAAATREPWLLLIDADARLAPTALGRAHAAAEARRLDALSLAGRPVARGMGENLLVPAVFALLDFMLGDWWAARDGGPAVASGQFVLVRRAALEAVGGFAAIRSATIDDVALVRALRAGGFRTGFWRAPDHLWARMYLGWAEAERGWRRNLAAIFDGRPLAAGLSLVAAAGPPLLAVLGLAVGAWPAALAVWLAGALASAILRLSIRAAPPYALLYPADALALAWTLTRALLDRRRGRLASWKGREIPL